MKVLHFSALDGRTGAGVAAARIHGQLLSRGVDSRFCVAYPAHNLKAAFRPAITPLDRLERAVSFRMDRARLAGAETASDYVLSTGRIGFDIGRIVRAERPDLVQLHWIAGGSFRLASLAGVRCPIVWRLSDMWPFCGLQHLETDRAAYTTAPHPRGGDLSERVRRDKQRVYARIADLTLACPSRWIMAEAAVSALLGDRPAELIPTSCDIEAFPLQDRMACRQALGLPVEAEILLVGATSLGTRWKGLDLFIQAAQRLSLKRKRRPTVVTFGADALAASALAGSVELIELGRIGDRSRMAQVFGAADVFAQPARLENLSNAVLEAMASGAPVAAFHIGGMPDMIGHQVNGWLSPPFDVDDYARGLGWLLDRRADHGLRTAARRTVAEGFSLARETDLYLDLYQRRLQAERPVRSVA